MELREMVENTQSQILELRKQLEDTQSAKQESKARFEAAEEELHRILPFEAELKEKNLLIGKLKHQAVGLNDHLTKALRQIQRGKIEDTIDKQLVTNNFLQFLSIDRADPKKFQVLQVMSAMLGWTEGKSTVHGSVILVLIKIEQRERAGLVRAGATNLSLRASISPWHRTPGTPTLSSPNLAANEGLGRKESIAGLFSDFLESEAEGGSSKATSVSSFTRPTS